MFPIKNKFKLKITGCIVGLMLAFLFGSTFPPLILNSFEWFNADLYRACEGRAMFCTKITSLGWFTIIFYFLFFGYVISVTIGSQKKTAKSAFINHFKVVVLTTITSLMLVATLNYFQNYLPKTPTSFRCKSIIQNKNNNFDTVNIFDFKDFRCVYEIAETTRDASWCKRFEEPGFRGGCVAFIAKLKNDDSICSATLTDPPSQHECIARVKNRK